MRAEMTPRTCTAKCRESELKRPSGACGSRRHLPRPNQGRFPRSLSRSCPPAPRTGEVLGVGIQAKAPFRACSRIEVPLAPDFPACVVSASLALFALLRCFGLGPQAGLRFGHTVFGSVRREWPRHAKFFAAESETARAVARRRFRAQGAFRRQTHPWMRWSYNASAFVLLTIRSILPCGNLRWALNCF